MLSLYRIQSCITISFHASHFPLLFYFGKKKIKKKNRIIPTMFISLSHSSPSPSSPLDGP